MESEQRGTGEQRESAYRFSILLGSFFALLVTVAVSRALEVEGEEEPRVLRAIVTLVLLAVVASAAFSVPAKPRAVRLLRVLAAVAVGLFLATLVHPSEILGLAALAVGIAFLGSTAVLISMFVLRAREADYETIAASLCAYMLLGVIWALLYTVVDMLVPGSFSYGGADQVLRFGTSESAKTLYFSYVTLTTLGFGDFSPKSDPARMVTVLEAIIGQLFLVVLVARLVGMSIAAPSSE